MVHYHLHKSPSLVPILRHVTTVHIMKHQLNEMNLNINLTSPPTSHMRSLQCSISGEKLLICHACYMSRI
jgi:hypothetical protein